MSPRIASKRVYASFRFIDTVCSCTCVRISSSYDYKQSIEICKSLLKTAPNTVYIKNSTTVHCPLLSSKCQRNHIISKAMLKSKDCGNFYQKNFYEANNRNESHELFIKQIVTWSNSGEEKKYNDNDE
uniref:Uncharacterized protein n=1 Tax=Glossina austeni TaxID=7395 RepID=A0A1A9VQP7_GLOAU